MNSSSSETAEQLDESGRCYSSNADDFEREAQQLWGKAKQHRAKADEQHARAAELRRSAASVETPEGEQTEFDEYQAHLIPNDPWRWRRHRISKLWQQHKGDGVWRDLSTDEADDRGLDEGTTNGVLFPVSAPIPEAAAAEAKDPKQSPRDEAYSFYWDMTDVEERTNHFVAFCGGFEAGIEYSRTHDRQPPQAVEQPAAASPTPEAEKPQVVEGREYKGASTSGHIVFRKLKDGLWQRSANGRPWEVAPSNYDSHVSDGTLVPVSPAPAAKPVEGEGKEQAKADKSQSDFELIEALRFIAVYGGVMNSEQQLLKTAPTVRELVNVQERLKRRVEQFVSKVAQHFKLTMPVISQAVSPVRTKLEELVVTTSQAVLGKLEAAKQKYGYTDEWLKNDWADDLRRKIREHVEKGDPRDVAAYAMFAIWHGWGLAVSPVPMEAEEIAANVLAENRKRHDRWSVQECIAEGIRRCNAYDALLAKLEKLSRDVAAISGSTFDGNLECMATPSEMRDRASELIAAALAEIEEMK